MIAKSDLIIMMIAASLLAAGVFHWRSNLENRAAARQVHSQQAATSASRPAGSYIPGSSTSAAMSKPSTNSPSTSQTGSVTPQNENSGPAPGAFSSSEYGRDNDPGNSQLSTPSIATQENNLPSADDGFSTPSSTDNGNEQAFGSYTIVSGDSLSYLAGQFGTTVSTLQELNNITGSLITVGQVIRYPLP